MSLYNDPQYFTGYRANLKATADQGDNSWTVVSEQLAFLTDIQNWTRLSHLRAN